MDADEKRFMERRIPHLRESVLQSCEKAIATMQSFVDDAKRELERAKMHEGQLMAADCQRLIEAVMSKAVWATSNVHTKMASASGEALTMAATEAKLGQ